MVGIVSQITIGGKNLFKLKLDLHFKCNKHLHAGFIDKLFQINLIILYFLL